MTVQHPDPIGFIGLGGMGGPLALRIAQAGWPLFVHDRNAEAMKPLQAAGATTCDSAQVVGARARIVLCCLPSPAASVEVAGALRRGGACEVLVETSTVGRAAIDEIAGAAGPGIAVLDCPVSGGTDKARAGRMSAIVAGPEALVARVRPVLDTFASRVFVVHQQPGMAQVCKLANNAIAITGLVVACEAVVMGAKAGLDPAVMIEVINASTGRNTATEEKFPRAILPRSFDYGGPISIGGKDLHLYLDEAKSLGVSSLAACNSSQLWDLAVQRLGPQADMSRFIRLLEELAGLDENGRPPQRGQPPKSCVQ